MATKITTIRLHDFDKDKDIGKKIPRGIVRTYTELCSRSYSILKRDREVYSVNFHDTRDECSDTLSEDVWDKGEYFEDAVEMIVYAHFEMKESEESASVVAMVSESEAANDGDPQPSRDDSGKKKKKSGKKDLMTEPTERRVTRASSNNNTPGGSSVVALEAGEKESELPSTLVDNVDGLPNETLKRGTLSSKKRKHLSDSASVAQHSTKRRKHPNEVPLRLEYVLEEAPLSPEEYFERTSSGVLSIPGLHIIDDADSPSDICASVQGYVHEQADGDVERRDLSRNVHSRLRGTIPVTVFLVDPDTQKIFKLDPTSIVPLWILLKLDKNALPERVDGRVFIDYPKDIWPSNDDGDAAIAFTYTSMTKGLDVSGWNACYVQTKSSMTMDQVRSRVHKDLLIQQQPIVKSFTNIDDTLGFDLQLSAGDEHWEDINKLNKTRTLRWFAGKLKTSPEKIVGRVEVWARLNFSRLRDMPEEPSDNEMAESNQTTNTTDADTEDNTANQLTDGQISRESTHSCIEVPMKPLEDLAIEPHASVTTFDKPAPTSPSTQVLLFLDVIDHIHLSRHGKDAPSGLAATTDQFTDRTKSLGITVTVRETTTGEQLLMNIQHDINEQVSDAQKRSGYNRRMMDLLKGGVIPGVWINTPTNHVKIWPANKPVLEMIEYQASPSARTDSLVDGDLSMDDQHSLEGRVFLHHAEGRKGGAGRKTICSCDELKYGATLRCDDVDVSKSWYHR
ncbi:hypothetical protein LTS18_002916 [Coniosporium uncinatum]|uniref:Uncharacterized protein n=1 Tax=Coniosporium uncinatum TaxID=93489 RepID=A0ACC3D7L5_9PEZI|nr:hypothetical protein LTS18_002916 [Coniosporium uncinatum]